MEMKPEIKQTPQNSLLNVIIIIHKINYKIWSTNNVDSGINQEIIFNSIFISI